MKQKRSGSIVNIISTTALDGRPFFSAYGASKSAAARFTKSIRAELEENNVNAINVYPGGIKTLLFTDDRPESYDTFMEPSYVASIIIENFKKNFITLFS